VFDIYTNQGGKGLITGRIVMVAGPVVRADRMKGVKMYEVVEVGDAQLIGEIIGLEHDQAIIQVYEDTTGLVPGEPVASTGMPLSVELGPGLMGTFYDGIQRPLVDLQDKSGDYIKRGIKLKPLDRSKKWHFVPTEGISGQHVQGGDILGTVSETKLIEHKIMVPPNMAGTITELLTEGKYKLDDPIGRILTKTGDKNLYLYQKWPVRTGRPYSQKFDPDTPLLTGQRVYDYFFPMAKGGTGAIPGGFGTGKTVTQHQLAKWCDSEIIVYVGCGERGNEMTNVLREFPALIDPHSGESLMNRTILIANTSNMPVAAREASIYTGITMAEYYRDMGYNVALMADSTSRWAEAMREISSRLEEMPGEEGFPAYLASRLADFYERAGRVRVKSSTERHGSISVVGAISPQGGDFSEPVTQNTLRIVKVFWALDADLADRRHFPSVNWLKSYSLYKEKIGTWWHDKVGPDWLKYTGDAMKILQQESDLQELIQLIGPDSLQPNEQALLETSRMLREDFLQQNAYHEVDTFCPREKGYRMLEIILKFHSLITDAVERGVEIPAIRKLNCRERIGRMATVPNEDYLKVFMTLEKEMESEIRHLK
jgi:V/A-type H+-transporting ATPase subunit A